MLPDPRQAPRASGESLPPLLEELRTARREVHRLRALRSPDQLSDAHRNLLGAMETYATALTACGMPTPWRLRDDLRLERSLDRGRNRFGR